MHDVLIICSGSRRPTSRTQSFNTERNMVQGNPAPEYIDIDEFQQPVQQPDVGFLNPNFKCADHYQPLDSANGRSEHVYERVKVAP